MYIYTIIIQSTKHKTVINETHTPLDNTVTHYPSIQQLLKDITELGSCVKVEVAVLGSSP